MMNVKNIYQIRSYSSAVVESIISQNKVYISQRRYFYGPKDRRKEYYGRKLVGYSADQMYTVVADVKNYRLFVPFCKKSSVLIERKDFLRAELEIGFPPIAESYTSNVSLIRPSLVRAVCTDGRLFSYLETTWRFSPGLRSNPQSCIIDFSIDFEFKSLLHSQLAHMFFDKVVKQMEGAFILEAKRRYGRESLPSHSLAVVKS